VQALAVAVQARCRETFGHSERVVALAVGVASALGLREVDDIAHVALLHDVGKLGVSDAVLSKPGPLTQIEWALMREHVSIGAEVVASVPMLAHLAPIVRSCHERFDGAGYPDGLAGEAIPLPSRIVFVCDAYDAMTSVRPYRPALREAETRQELQRQAGVQFCPSAVAALVHVLTEARPAR
jgi:HD-GYP domain-containing protein (c-di-GMP phosphodiesterase class II)